MSSEITITRPDDWRLNVRADGTKEVQNRKIISNVIATAPPYRWRSSYA